jgi:hypothetical protein
LPYTNSIPDKSTTTVFALFLPLVHFFTVLVNKN